MSGKNIYKKVAGNPNFAELEEKILEFWQEDKSFERSVDERDSKIDGENNEYVFYDGPPFANGMPHHGHLLTGFVKDLFARFQTMQGKRTERRFGWDTHGLPVEMETEKELSISGKVAITEFGIDKFNDACKASVMKYAGKWKDYVSRQGRWVDFENSYKTMDLNYMESVIWAFKELHKKGLIYQDFRVMPYSWACQTPLSNFETRLDNSYRQKESKALTILVTLKDLSPVLTKLSKTKPIKCAVWTTTPWTLPSNLALAVGKEIKYSLLEREDDFVLVAKPLVGRYKNELSQYVTDNDLTINGSDIIGSTYEPVFSFLKNSKNHDLRNAFSVYAADFVTTEDGTGIVHIAPGFGEDDQELCKKVNIPTICPVDDAGCFTSEIPDFKGRQVFDTNIDIIKSLKEQGSWLKTEQYLHNYPHCWRTDTPLIYKAVSSWYVKVTEIKDQMVKLNQEINWIPSHIRDGQFGKWLENARDWSISRNRFWGCPVPIWISDDPTYPRIDVYGSLDEIEKDFGVRPNNLHRPYIDELTRANPDDPSGNSKMVRVQDVLDCWFESGSMPYAQAHYPFENKEWFEEHFPADFIVEYIAQTRGWFYTLMVLSTALFNRPPFKNCICHGVILDENSQKLSKRLKNYTPPEEIFNKYGSDSMRWFMCSSSVMRGNELNIDKDGNVFKDSLRLYIRPIWNSYNFFILYANADEIEAEFSFASKNLMDVYIISKCHFAVKEIESALLSYDTITAYNAAESFFDVLNNWCIRRNRERFWQHDKNQDKIDAYNSLYSVLLTMVTAMAPLVPFIAEEVFRGLKRSKKLSVHLERYPDYQQIPYNEELVSEMDKVREICNVAHSIRSKQNIRIRQPLSQLQIVGDEFIALEKYFPLIKDEINVKEIKYIASLEEAADFRLVLNFKVLGKRLGSKIKEVTTNAKLGKWSHAERGSIKVGDEILQNGEYELQVIAKGDDAMQPLANISGLVGLNLNITEELLEEGIARDVVRFVQQKRKDLDLDITDNINLGFYVEDPQLEKAIMTYKDYVCEQTLAKSLDLYKESKSGNFEQIDDMKIEIIVSKA